MMEQLGRPPQWLKIQYRSLAQAANNLIINHSAAVHWRAKSQNG